MISKNGIALAVLAVEALLSALGIEFEPGTVARAVEGILITASLLLMIWNQLMRYDIQWFFLKQK
jgi:hypothetical protein